MLFPVLRSVSAVMVVIFGGEPFLLVLLGLSTAGWAAGRLKGGLRTTVTWAVGSVAAVAALDAYIGWFVTLVAVALWLLEDAADWHSDRLVVTNKRIYRRYGVVTQHAPSIALSGAAFIDPSVPPLGRMIGYGTLGLDSAAQNDAPLSRFELMADVVPLSHEILRLRSQAMPKFPTAG